MTLKDEFQRDSDEVSSSKSNDSGVIIKDDYLGLTKEGPGRNHFHQFSSQHSLTDLLRKALDKTNKSDKSGSKCDSKNDSSRKVLSSMSGSYFKPHSRISNHCSVPSPTVNIED